MIYTLVESESGDWFIVPVERTEEFVEFELAHATTPSWAIYVQSPEHVTFTTWECDL